LTRCVAARAQVRARVLAQLRAEPDAYSVFVTEPYDEYCTRMGCVVCADPSWAICAHRARAQKLPLALC
jgi:hypothetical protein